MADIKLLRKLLTPVPCRQGMDEDLKSFFSMMHCAVVSLDVMSDHSLDILDKIEIPPGQGEYPQIPKALPLTNVQSELDLKAPMIVSLVMRLHKPG